MLNKKIRNDIRDCYRKEELKEIIRLARNSLFISIKKERRKERWARIRGEIEELKDNADEQIKKKIEKLKGGNT